jgi:hypothetical protein
VRDRCSGPLERGQWAGRGGIGVELGKAGEALSDGGVEEVDGLGDNDREVRVGRFGTVRKSV